MLRIENPGASGAGAWGDDQDSFKQLFELSPDPTWISDGSHSVEIGVSIGIAIYPVDGQNADALIKDGDSVMYSAKQVGSSFRFGVPDS